MTASMLNLSPQQWAQLEQWLDAALDQPEPARAAYVAGLEMPESLRGTLQEWLDAEAESRGLLAASQSPLLSTGERIGPWAVLGLLGRGGSGEVYHVRRVDGSYEQEAALKLLTRPEEADDLRRFTAERRLLARLEHADIARLLDGGVHDGRPYAVLERVDGVRLDHYAAGRPLAERLTLFRRVCAAVAYAHRHLIVHRDLKPANVLVTAAGAPKLLDFGIAKPLESREGEATLALRLTPDYCAPEQLQGGAITPATDVFALGVMLHELITGQAAWPLAGAGVQRALDRLAHAELPPPSSRLQGAAARAVRGDLDAIVVKATQPDPAARYAHAEALLDDLQRAADGRPVSARGDALGYLLGRVLRRHRLLVAAVASALLALLLGGAGILWQAREAARERDIAREEAARSAAVKDYLLTLFRVAGESAGQEPLTAKQLLDKGAARLQQYLEKNPEAPADTLLALAELYFRLNDYTGAAPLFEQLLLRQPAVPAEMAARTRLNLAQCYLRMSRYEAAQNHLQTAQEYWMSNPGRYRNLLLESRSTQAQLQRAQGDAAGSIATLEAALAEREAVSGAVHPETGTLLNDLAVAYFQANRLADARALFQRAWAMWQTLGAAESVDALNTLNNWASLEVREQNLTEAERLYRQALETRRALFGPSAALAALLNNLGKLQLRLDRADAALPLLREALTLAREYAGVNSLNALAAQAGVGEALTATGAGGEAAVVLADLDQRVREHFGENHILMALAHLAQTRRLLAAGDRRAARGRLNAAEAVLTAAGPQGAVYLPQVQALRESIEAGG